MARQSTDSGSDTVKAVERAFAVVRSIAASEESVGVSAIARSTDLPKSTVARLLATLEGLEIVERIDAGGRYQVGPGLAVLTASAPGVGVLREVARPYLRDLVTDVGEDAGLAVTDGTDVLYIDQVQCESPVQVQDWTGWRVPPHTVAAGFVLMAGWPRQRLDAYLDGRLESFTPDTPTDPAEVRRLVARAGANGQSWTHRTFADDINGVAAPVARGDGRIVAAVTVYGPAYRFPGEAGEAELGALVVDVADRITDHLTGGSTRS